MENTIKYILEQGLLQYTAAILLIGIAGTLTALFVLIRWLWKKLSPLKSWNDILTRMELAEYKISWITKMCYDQGLFPDRRQKKVQVDEDRRQK